MAARRSVKGVHHRTDRANTKRRPSHVPPRRIQKTQSTRRQIMVELPQWPRVQAICYASGGAHVTINGTSHAINEQHTAEETRDTIRQHAATVAQSLERPVRVTVTDYAEAQTVHLVVSPNAGIEPEPSKPVEPHKVGSAQSPDTTPEPSLEDWTDAPTAQEVTQPQSDQTEPPAEQQDRPPLTRRQARESFLNQAKHDKPASKGFRGLLNQLGLRLSPSASEQAERDDIHKVSQHWAG